MTRAHALALLAGLSVGAGVLSPPSRAGASAVVELEALFARLDGNRDGALVAAEAPRAHARLFRRLARVADADRDGRLSAPEFVAGLQPAAQPKPMVKTGSGPVRAVQRTARLLLLKLDTNGDARLTRSESPPSLRGAFDRLAAQADRNDDQMLALPELARATRHVTRLAVQLAQRLEWDVEAELGRLETNQGEAAKRFDSSAYTQTMRGDASRAGALFGRLDANGDGSLSIDELPEPARARYGRLLRRADRDGSGDVSRREFAAAMSRAGVMREATDGP